jgi:hypothetical protein
MRGPGPGAFVGVICAVPSKFVMVILLSKDQFTKSVELCMSYRKLRPPLSVICRTSLAVPIIRREGSVTVQNLLCSDVLKFLDSAGGPFDAHGRGDRCVAATEVSVQTIAIKTVA